MANIIDSYISKPPEQNPLLLTTKDAPVTLDQYNERQRLVKRAQKQADVKQRVKEKQLESSSNIEGIEQSHIDWQQEKTQQVNKAEAQAYFEKTVREGKLNENQQALGKIIDKRSKGLSLDELQQYKEIQKNIGMTQNGFSVPDSKPPVFTKAPNSNYRTNIPTSSPILKNEPALNKALAKKAEYDAIKNTEKNIAQEAGEGIMKGFMKSKYGKVAAGLGVTAFLVSNMNKSKGQQTNSQLYGQQNPYQ